MIYRSTAVAASLLCQIPTPVAALAERNQAAPENSFMANGEWHCFSGHRKEGNRCVSILAELAAAPVKPSNATRVSFTAERNQTAPENSFTVNGDEPFRQVCQTQGYADNPQMLAGCISWMRQQPVNPSRDASKPINSTVKDQSSHYSKQPSSAVVDDPYLAVGARPVTPYKRDLETRHAEACEFSDQSPSNCGDFSRNIAEARAGNTERYISVAIQYMHGIGVNKDIDKALYWALRAEKVKIPESYVFLSEWYLLSIGVNQDIQKSFDYIRIAKAFGYQSRKLVEIEKKIVNFTGKYGYECLKYGLTYKSGDFATCAIQMEEAALRLKQEKHRLAMEEQVIIAELQQRTIEAKKQLEIEQERGRQIANEIENSNRRSREQSAAAWFDLAGKLAQPTYSQPSSGQITNELRSIRRCLGDRAWC